MNGILRFAEVQYYFTQKLNEELHAMALVILYSRPDLALWKRSSGTLYVCTPGEDKDCLAIDVQSILSVISMPAFKPPNEERVAHDERFMVEKIGLEIAYMSGITQVEGED